MSSLSLRKVIRWRGGMKEGKRRKKNNEFSGNYVPGSPSATPPVC
jgi:hypothetical protein